MLQSFVNDMSIHCSRVSYLLLLILLRFLVARTAYEASRAHPFRRSLKQTDKTWDLKPVRSTEWSSNFANVFQMTHYLRTYACLFLFINGKSKRDLFEDIEGNRFDRVLGEIENLMLETNKWYLRSYRV